MTSNGQSGTAEAGSILDRPRTTVTGARQVLFLVHTMTSANRLSDLVSTFEGDFRVELFFSCPRGSTLPTGVREHLQGHGVTPMDWSTVLLRRWDLIISANHSADLETLNGPLITLSHGVGYSKIITRNRKPETGNRKPETGNRKPETGNRKPVYGLCPESLTRNGRVVPDVVVLSHEEELNRLAASVPRAVDRAVVLGDPRFDRLLASTHKRAEYRRALGVSDDEVFVVLSSTWSPSSLLGSWPDLPRRLLAEIPVDGWRVGAVLHPHVWFEHGPTQVRLWLADCLRAGLILIPPEEGWSAALIAADVVIGDHGAVTCYAAGLGRPVLLAAFPADEVAPGSAVDLLGRHAPSLRPDLPLPEQINSVRRAHPPHGHSAVVRMISSAPGQWAGSFRRTCYQRLSLSEPDLPTTTPVLPLPRPIGGRALGLQVSGLVSAPDEVRLRRYPVDVPSRSAPEPGETHLVIHADHPAPGFRDNADVVFIHAADSPLTPEEWLRHTTAIRHLAIAAVILDERRCRVRLRDGGELMVTGRVECPWLDPLAAVSAVHLLLARSDPTLPSTVRVGASIFDLSRPPRW